MSAVLRPLNLFKGTAAANAALAGSTIILVAFAIIQSIAIDQFMAIQTARPKLELALLQAQQPIDLAQIFGQPNGSDLALYYWAKAMEADFVLEYSAGAVARSHRSAASTTKWIPVGDWAINQGSGIRGQGSGYGVRASACSSINTFNEQAKV